LACRHQLFSLTHRRGLPYLLLVKCCMDRLLVVQIRRSNIVNRSKKVQSGWSPEFNNLANANGFFCIRSACAVSLSFMSQLCKIFDCLFSHTNTHTHTRTHTNTHTLLLSQRNNEKPELRNGMTGKFLIAFSFFENEMNFAQHFPIRFL